MRTSRKSAKHAERKPKRSTKWHRHTWGPSRYSINGREVRDCTDSECKVWKWGWMTMK